MTGKWLFKVFFLINLWKINFNESKHHLPQTSAPIHYDLKLTIDIDQKIFSGNVTIFLNVTQNTNSLSLNTKNLKLESESVKLYNEGEDESSFALQSIEYNETYEISSFLFDREIQLGAYSFIVNFSGLIGNDRKGLHLNEYYEGDNQSFSVISIFAPIYARMAFPCYDEPYYKATFNISLIHSSLYSAVSNDRVSNEIDLPNGWHQTDFEETYKLSTHRIGFSISKFAVNRSPIPPSIFTVYSNIHSKTDLLNLTDYSRLYINRAYTNGLIYTQFPHERNKRDVVLIDDLPGVPLTLLGLTVFHTSDLIISDVLTSAKLIQDIRMKVAESVMEEQYGNIVTCDWWSDLWITRGVAGEISYSIDRILNGAFAEFSDVSIVAMYEAMEWDAELTAEPIHRKIESLQEVEGIYSNMKLKNKEQRIFRMFGNFGLSFLDTLSMTLVKIGFRYENVDTKQFYEYTEEAQTMFDRESPRNVRAADILKHYAETPGFALLNVTRFYDGDEFVKFTQQRFVGSYVDVASDHRSKYRYYIPIDLVTTAHPYNFGSDPIIVMDPLETNFQLNLTQVYNATITDDEYIQVNFQGTFYYRVNYDERNWRLLVAEMKQSLPWIVAENRAQLIDDSFTLARYGYISYDIPISLIKYVSNEEVFIPLQVATKQLKYLGKNMRATHSETFNRFLSKLFAPIYEKHRLWPTANDEWHPERLARYEVALFSCQFGVDACYDDAVQVYNGNAKASPDGIAAAYCGVIATHSNIDEIHPWVYNNLKALTRNEGARRQNVNELKNIFRAFGCRNSDGNNLKFLTNVLDLTLEDHADIHLGADNFNDIFDVVVESSSNGVDLGLLLLDNDGSFEKITKRYNSVAQVFISLGRNIITDHQFVQFINVIKRRVEENSDAGEDLKQAATDGIDKALENLEWRKRYLDEVAMLMSTASALSFMSSLYVTLFMIFIR